MKVLLNTEDRVVKLINYTSKHNDVEFDLVKGKMIIDAKSILGIHSFDLSKPLELNVRSASKNVEAIEKELNELVGVDTD